MSNGPYSRTRLRRSGAALVVVLAVVVLMSGLVVAFLSRATAERRISNQFAGHAKADLLARSALSVIVGDLKREIIRGSDADITDSPVIYVPRTAAAILPARSGTASGSPDPVPNLVRRSVRNDSIPVPSRASAVNSSDDVSINGRSIPTARWNAHYLIPKANPSDDESDPVAAFKAPDWVIVTRSGIAVKTGGDVAAMSDPASPDFAVGRYAYAIYDEGGLLDVNAAGYESALGLSATLTAARGSLAFVSLAVLPGLEATRALNDFIAWRNFGTLRAAGDFGKHNFTFAEADAFTDFALNNPERFLAASPNSWRGHGDQVIVNRQELIAMRRSLEMSVNSLQYLGTFSRDWNLPTLPRVLKLRVKTPFVRKDGTSAVPGMPLLQRFALERIEGLKNIPPSDSDAVQRDFGLVAMQGTGGSFFWRYCGVSGTALKSGIDNSWSVNGDREPDFFEMIAFLSGSNVVTGDILSAGADIIDQFDADTDSTRIGYLSMSGSVCMAGGTDAACFLNRPFQSVGEMRYADGTTDEMADLFCARKSGESALLRGGVVNRNSRNIEVLAAIFAGAYTQTSTPAGGLSVGDAHILAKALPGIAQSRGEGLGGLAAAAGIGSKADPALASRALAEVSTTRVWDLMIDVVAQSGRFVPGARDLSRFSVDGESRYWLHLALDRFTGKILDVQIEAVHE